MPTDEKALFWPEWEQVKVERWDRLWAFARALGMNEYAASEYADTCIRDAMPTCLSGG